MHFLEWKMDTLQGVYARVWGIQIAFYTIHSPCQRCNERRLSDLSHYFIDSMHQLEKSHALGCSSCGRVPSQTERS